MAESINPINLIVVKEVVRHPNLNCNVELLSMKIHVKLNDISLDMTFDTSSQFSSLIRMIPGSPLQPASMSAVGPDGRKINLRGQQRLRVTIGKFVFYHTFLVLPESATKRKELLGLDVISKVPMTFTTYGMDRRNTVPLEGSTQNHAHRPAVRPPIPTHTHLAHHLKHLNHHDRSDFMKAVKPYLLLFTRDSHTPSEMNGVPEAFYPLVVKQLQDFMKLGLVMNLENSSGAPLLVVREKARYTKASYRFCDFKALGNITKADVIPLPNLQHTFASLGNSQFFTTLDLTGGYVHLNRMLQLVNQSELSELRRYFGSNPILLDHKNAPAAFQKAMTMLLEKLIGITCFVYLDAILIFSASLETHSEHVCQVLERLSQVNIKINVKECHFFKKSVEYLGHSLINDGVKIHQLRVDSMLNFPEPQNIRQVKSFLGLVGYYRRFINHFSAHSLPLTKLLQKDKTFVWGLSEKTSFVALREAIKSAPLLRYPQRCEKLVLFTKMSPNHSTLGAILCQQICGSLKVVEFASRTLNQKEMKYTLTEKKILCAAWACTHYQIYLEEKFWLDTDSSAMTAAMKFRDKTSKVGRWVTKLLKYNYVLRDSERNMPAEARNMTPEEFFQWRVLSASQELDPWIQTLITKLNERVPVLRDQYTINNKVLCLKHPDNPVPLTPSSLRSTLISIGHNRATHTGIAVTEYYVRTRGSWRRLKSDVQKYVQNCPCCRIRTIDSPPAVEPFKSSKIMEMVGIDFVGPLPSRNGSKYLLAIMDQLSKYVEIYTVDEATPKTAAFTLMNHFVPKHGLPERILSDQLSVTILSAELQLLGIHSINVLPYHTHGNGCVERFHKTLEAIVYRINKECKAPDWEVVISSVRTVYLNLTHYCTGFSPHRLLYGRELQVPSSLYSAVHDPNSSDKPMEKPVKVARRATITVLKEIWFSRRLILDQRRSSPSYEQGQLVYFKQLKLPDGVTEKAWCPWIGPLYVTGQQTNVTYEIENVLGGKHCVHVYQLKPALTGDVDDVISELEKWSLSRRNDAVQGPAAVGTSGSSKIDVSPELYTLQVAASISNIPKVGVTERMDLEGVSSGSADICPSITSSSKASSQATFSDEASQPLQNNVPKITVETIDISSSSSETSSVYSSNEDIFMSQMVSSYDDHSYRLSEKVTEPMESECQSSSSSLAKKRPSEVKTRSQPSSCKKRASSHEDFMSLVEPCFVRLERLSSYES